MRTLCWLVLMAFFLGSCSGFKANRAAYSPEEALRSRAIQYWRAQKEKDWNKVRTFVDPEVAEKSRNYFRKREESGAYCTILSADIKEVEVDKDVGHVTIAVATQVTHPLLGGTPYVLNQTVEERWVLRKGLWYVVINDVNVEDLFKKLQMKPASP